MLNLKSPMQSPRNSKVRIFWFHQITTSWHHIYKCAQINLKFLNKNNFPAVLSTIRVSLRASLCRLIVQWVPWLPQVVAKSFFRWTRESRNLSAWGVVVLAVIIIPKRLIFFSLQQQAGHGRVIPRWDLGLNFEGLVIWQGKAFFLQNFFRVDSRDNFRFRVARLPGEYFGECNND